MDVCILMYLDASSGQMNIIPVDTAAGAEVNIQTFGVMDAGMLTLYAFLISSEHLFSMLALSLVYKADIHIGGFARGRRGVFKLQNCLLACFEPFFQNFHHLSFIMFYAQISVVYTVAC